MKKILSVIVLLWSCSSANATNLGVIESSATVNTVTISSFTATSVTSATTLMRNRTSIVLQNLDTSNNIFCGFDSVTVTTSAYSFLIPVNGGTFSADMRGFGIWCITAKTTGSSQLAVIQSY